MAKETGFVNYSGSRAIFYSGKNLFKLVKWIEGFETKLQTLESPDSDKQAKSYTKTKIGSEIRSGIIAENPRKRKTDEQANERAFAVCKKENENHLLKPTYGRTSAN